VLEKTVYLLFITGKDKEVHTMALSCWSDYSTVRAQCWQDREASI